MKPVLCLFAIFSLSLTANAACEIVHVQQPNGTFVAQQVCRANSQVVTTPGSGNSRCERKLIINRDGRTEVVVYCY